MEVLIVKSLQIDVSTVITGSSNGPCCCGWPWVRFQRGFTNWAAVAAEVQVCKRQGGAICISNLKHLCTLIYVFSHTG